MDDDNLDDDDSYRIPTSPSDVFRRNTRETERGREQIIRRTQSADDAFSNPKLQCLQRTASTDSHETSPTVIGCKMHDNHQKINKRKEKRLRYIRRLIQLPTKKKLTLAAVTVQRHWRGYDARLLCKYRQINMKLARDVTIIQTRWRVVLAKRILVQERLQEQYGAADTIHKSATVIQTIIRGHLQRLQYKMEFLERTHNNLVLQKAIELEQVQKSLVQRKENILEEEVENVLLTNTLQMCQETISALKQENKDWIEQADQYQRNIEQMQSSLSEQYDKMLSLQFMNLSKGIEIHQIQGEYEKLVEAFEKPFREHIQTHKEKISQLDKKIQKARVESKVLIDYIDRIALYRFP